MAVGTRGVRAQLDPLLSSFGGNDAPEGHPHWSLEHQRQLGGSADGGYLVDQDGNAYAPYSLAWRYLGVFLDYCDDRRLEEEGKNNNNYMCRKVLWAAYHDPGYSGHSIAEYQFFNKENGSWDGSTCRARTYGIWWPFTRCQKLDCHQASTNFQLVGVFKETDGLYDFTEQLFKHQGYCLWDADKNENGSGDHNSADQNGGYGSSDYNFMTSLAKSWVDGCNQFENDLTDEEGRYLYYDTKPLPGGDITYGVYIDASCTVESSVTWADIVEYLGYGNDNGNDNWPTSLDSFDRWNDLLSDFKLCQPCRAYNRIDMRQPSSHDSSGDSEEDEEDYEDGDDGEGGKEPWGFNCYDAAGYTNCNQCYKFQTQTDMEPASISDLERASKQGTILAVKVDGKSYGKGHYGAGARALHNFKTTCAILACLMVFVGMAYYCYRKKFPDIMGNDGDLQDKLTHQDENDRSLNFYLAPFRKRLRSFFVRNQQLNSVAPTTQRDKHTTWRRADAYLVEQLKERDSRLKKQEHQIQELQKKLEYYESNQSTGSQQQEILGIWERTKEKLDSYETKAVDRQNSFSSYETCNMGTRQNYQNSNNQSGNSGIEQKNGQIQVSDYFNKSGTQQQHHESDRESTDFAGTMFGIWQQSEAEDKLKSSIAKPQDDISFLGTLQLQELHGSNKPKRRNSKRRVEVEDESISSYHEKEDDYTCESHSSYTGTQGNDESTYGPSATDTQDDDYSSDSTSGETDNTSHTSNSILTDRESRARSRKERWRKGYSR